MMEFTAEMIAGFLGGEIVGDKEAEAGTVAVRTRSGGDEGVMDLPAFLTRCRAEIDSKSKDI